MVSSPLPKIRSTNSGTEERDLAKVQAEYLRHLAERVEKGALSEKDERVLEAIEDELAAEMDREAIEAAKGQPTIPYDSVRRELGIE